MESVYEQDLGTELFLQLLDHIIPERDIHLADKLGSGFFGDVYKGTHVQKSSLRQVAVKFLKGKVTALLSRTTIVIITQNN